MKGITKLLIADDHALIRKGLKQFLEPKEGLTIFEASNGEEALKVIEEHQPGIAILDIEMPKLSGFDVAKIAFQRGLKVNIVFLTMYSDEAIFNKAMDIGVKGYVLKENTVSEIEQCIDKVMNGRYYLSPSISDFLMRRNQKVVNTPSDQQGLDQLTPTEKVIMKLLSEMKTNQEIAEEMGVTIKTVQNHRNNICNKLDLHGAHALLKFAVENSILF